MTAAQTVAALDKFDVSPYATDHFEYVAQTNTNGTTNPDAGKVLSQFVQGAGNAITYTYSPNSTNTPGMNNWTYKTTITNPDGGKTTDYLNAYGEVMLGDFHTSAGDWLTYNQFNAQGRIIEIAAPSAVTGMDETKADLVDHGTTVNGYISTNNDVIAITDYYSTPFAAIGYVRGALTCKMAPAARMCCKAICNTPRKARAIW